MVHSHYAPYPPRSYSASSIQTKPDQYEQVEYPLHQAQQYHLDVAPSIQTYADTYGHPAFAVPRALTHYSYDATQYYAQSSLRYSPSSSYASQPSTPISTTEVISMSYQPAPIPPAPGSHQLDSSDFYSMTTCSTYASSEPPSPLVDLYTQVPLSPSSTSAAVPVGQMYTGVRVIRTRDEAKNQQKLGSRSSSSSMASISTHPTHSSPVTTSATRRKKASSSSPISSLSIPPTASLLNQDVVNDRYLCTKCGKTFSRAHDRKRHWETHHHPNPVVHKCGECGREFGRSDSLKRHIEHGACHKR
ncbi:hypothetical protein DL96DRAFT_995566 [Flagelloscypha sp. PMI_526]|nr:hypothetical protein DL96DRAFT_995566 [Flagelloscypha sp. PMI_526]